jgi:hypothetical protein
LCQSQILTIANNPWRCLRSWGLNRAGRNDSQTDLFGVLAIRVAGAGLGDELTEVVAAALEAMLKRSLSPGHRLSAGLNAARYWMRAGRLGAPWRGSVQ